MFHEINEYIRYAVSVEEVNMPIVVNFSDKKWNKCRLRASLEDCDRGKSLGRIDGCSCSCRYYRFLSTRQRRRCCVCIRDFIQPCEGPSIAGGGTNGTSAGGPGPSPNTTTLHYITQRTPAHKYYPCN